MNLNTTILLPGLAKQFSFLSSRLNLSTMRILIIGSQTVPIGKKLQNDNQVEIIVEEYESLMNTKLALNKEDKLSVKIMDFERTDYQNNEFDLIYSQGSISNYRRKNIVKEAKRILKTGGYFCVGEVIKLEKSVPQFVRDIFESSELDPLYKDEVLNYYLQRNFEEIDSQNLSDTLKEYYSSNISLLKQQEGTFNSSEKSYLKTILNKLSHESNAYLKLGADKFIGFESLLLKKK